MAFLKKQSFIILKTFMPLLSFHETKGFTNAEQSDLELLISLACILFL